MGNEVDQYILKETEDRSKENKRRIDGLERREEKRELMVSGLKAAVKQNNAMLGAIILAIIGAALAVFFGVGHA